MRRVPHGGRRISLACLAILLGGCTSGASPADRFERSPAGPQRQEPWPDRPVVDLSFVVSDDLDSVTGREWLSFTPDLPTCALVFRSWANKPITAWAGSSMVVTRVLVDDREAVVVDVPAGAPPQAPAGTLQEVPLDECLEAGDRVTAEIAFEVDLGEDVDERVGASPDDEVAWFATAFPLLAWQRDEGWDRGPAVPVSGEMAVSEDFELFLSVQAPADLDVLATGTDAGTSEGPRGTTVHRFSAPAVRDVAVSVGDLTTAEREISATRVRVAADRGVQVAEPEDWLDQIERSMADLVDLLGPFPYPELSVTVLSAQSSGIEFPGAIQFGDVDPEERRGLVTHELAHMWFYGLVGNDQGEHPWLDESFATFAQQVADRDAEPYVHPEREPRLPVGASMSEWADVRRPSSSYYDTVYTLGGAALVEARERAGHEAFDAALADYLRRNAHSLATPDDVRESFGHLPDVLAVLQDVGALS
jgi:Peptidase family M1 domain